MKFKVGDRIVFNLSKKYECKWFLHHLSLLQKDEKLIEYKVVAHDLIVSQIASYFLEGEIKNLCWSVPAVDSFFITVEEAEEEIV